MFSKCCLLILIGVLLLQDGSAAAYKQRDYDSEANAVAAARQNKRTANMFYGLGPNRQRGAKPNMEGVEPVKVHTPDGVYQKTAYKMKLKEGDGILAEYKKRHDEIWPEVVSQLKAWGLKDYSIFFDAETRFLFAVLYKRVEQQVAKEDSASGESAANPTIRKWWDSMAPFVEADDDRIPKTYPLPCVFHMT